MVKETFSEIGITGKTNHSLRATGASALFEANVPKKVIQKQTRHRSVKALNAQLDIIKFLISFLVKIRNSLSTGRTSNKLQANFQ